MPQHLKGEHDGAGVKIAIVAARFNEWVTDQLLEGALAEVSALGGDADGVPVAHVPGSLELGVAAKKFATAGYEAVVCLGCVIEGQTDHYRAVVDGARQGVVQAGIETGIPVIFGVLTVRDRGHAAARCAPDRNAGAGAVRTAVEMARLMRKIQS